MKAESIDINERTIHENRPNIHAVLYPTPDQYNSTAESVFFNEG